MSNSAYILSEIEKNEITSVMLWIDKISSSAGTTPFWAKAIAVVAIENITQTMSRRRPTHLFVALNTKVALAHFSRVLLKSCLK